MNLLSYVMEDGGFIANIAIIFFESGNHYDQ